MTAIFGLTVRQLAGSRRLWLVLGLVSLPVLAAVVFRVGDSTTCTMTLYLRTGADRYLTYELDGSPG